MLSSPRCSVLLVIASFIVVLCSVVPTSAVSGASRYWYTPLEYYQQTVVLEPTPPLEWGTHFTVRLKTTYPPGFNASYGAVQIRLIKTVNALGKTTWCNRTDTITIAQVNDVYPSGSSRANVGHANTKSVSEVSAVFVTPTVDFRICYMNQNFTGSGWLMPDGETGFGTLRNVTEPRAFFAVDNNDYTAGSYAAVKITSSAYKLHANPSDALRSDQLKLVKCGRPCMHHIDNHLFPGNGPDWDSQQRMRGTSFLSTTQNIVPGGYLVNTQFTSASSASSLTTGDHLTMYARIQLPSEGCYQVCYSMYNERVAKNATVWRYLYKAGTLTTTFTTTSKYAHKVNWTMTDRRSHTWGALRISTTATTSKLSNAPATTAFPNVISIGGNQVRLVPESKFTSATNAPPTGCFDATNLGGTTNIGLNGPTESSDLGAAPTDAGFPWAANTMSDAAVYAYLRLPTAGRYRVCWQAAGQNWYVLPSTYVAGVSNPEVFSVADVFGFHHLNNLTWSINDTAAGSWAPLHIHSYAPILRNTPNLPTNPQDNAVAVRLVSATTNCHVGLAQKKAEVWDTGIEETPWGRYAGKGSLDDDPLLRTDVVAHVQVPDKSTTGYRVCVKLGAENWLQVEPLLFPSNGYALSATIADTRAGTWGRFYVHSGAPNYLDIRPVKPWLQGGVYRHAQGDQLKLVKNGTNCDRTSDAAGLGWGDSYTDADLGLYCNYASSEGTPCSGKSNGYSDSTVDAVHVRNAVAYITLPTERVEGYTMCYKMSNRNWQELGSVSVRPGPQLSVAFTGRSPADGSYAGAFQNVDITQTARNFNPALNLTSGTDQVKLVPVNQNCDRDAVQRAIDTNLDDPTGNNHDAGATSMARASFTFPIEADRRMTYAVCYKFRDYVNWYRFPTALSLTPSGIVYYARSIPQEDGVLELSLTSEARFDTRPGRDAAKIIKYSPVRWCVEEEPAVSEVVTNLGPSDESGASLATFRVKLPHEGSQQHYRVCYRRFGFPWMEVNETLKTIPSDGRALSSMPVTGAAANAILTRLSPLSVWSYAAKSRTELSVPYTVAAIPQYVAGTVTRQCDSSISVICNYAITISGQHLENEYDRFKLVKSQEWRGTQFYKLDVTCNDEAVESTIADYGIASWSMAKTVTSDVLPFFMMPLAPARYVACYRAQNLWGTWLQVPGFEVETVKSHLVWTVASTSTGKLVFTVYDDYVNSSRVTEATMVPGDAGDQFQIVNDTYMCGDGAVTYKFTSSSSCTTNCSVLSTSEVTTPTISGSYRICYRKAINGPNAYKSTWMQIPSSTGDTYYRSGAATKLSVISRVLYNITSPMRLGDVMEVTVEAQTDAGARVFSSSVVMASVVSSIGAVSVPFLNTDGTCKPQNSTDFSWPATNSYQVMADGRVTFRIQILGTCGAQRVCHIQFNSAGLTGVTLEVITRRDNVKGLQTVPFSRSVDLFNPTTPLYTGLGESITIPIIALDSKGSRVFDASDSIIVTLDSRDIGSEATARCFVASGETCTATATNTYEVPFADQGITTIRLSFSGMLLSWKDGRNAVRFSAKLKSDPTIFHSVQVHTVVTVPTQLLVADVVALNSKWESTAALPQLNPTAADGYYFQKGMAYRVILQPQNALGIKPDQTDISATELLVSIVGGGGTAKGGVLTHTDGSLLKKPTPVNGVYSIDLVFTEGCGVFLPDSNVREYCRLRFDAGTATGFLSTPVRAVGTELRFETTPNLRTRPGLPFSFPIITTDSLGFRDYFNFAWIFPELTKDSPYRRGLVELTSSNQFLDTPDTTRGPGNLALQMESGRVQFTDLALSWPCEDGGCEISFSCSWGCGFLRTGALNCTEDMDHLSGNMPGTYALVVNDWINVDVFVLTAQNETTHSDTAWLWSTLTAGVISSTNPAPPRLVVEGGRAQPLAKGKRRFRVKFLDSCLACVLTFEAKSRAGWTDYTNGNKRVWSTQPFEVLSNPTPYQIAFDSISPWMKPVADAPAGTLWFEGEYNTVFNISIKTVDILGREALDSRALETNAYPSFEKIGFNSIEMKWKATGPTVTTVGGRATFAYQGDMPCAKCEVDITNLLTEQTRRLFPLKVYVTLRPNATKVVTVDPTVNAPTANVDIFPTSLMPYSLGYYTDEWTGPRKFWLVEELRGLWFVDTTKDYTVTVGHSDDYQYFSCDSAIMLNCSGKTTGYVTFTLPSRSPVKALANPSALFGLIDIVGHLPSVSGKFTISSEKARNGVSLTPYVQSTATTWTAAVTPNRLVIMNVSTNLGPGHSVIESPGYESRTLPHPPFSFNTPHSLYAGAAFPVTVQIHNFNGNVSRPVTDKQGEGTIQITAERITGCGTGTPVTVTPTLASLMNGNVTVWVTFASPCEQCRLRIEYLQTTQPSAGLTRAESIKYTEPLTIRPLTPDYAIINTPASSIPASMKVSDKIAMTILTVRQVQSITHASTNAVRTDFVVTMRNRPTSYYRTFGNGGFLVDTALGIPHRVGVSSEFKFGVAEFSFSFTRACEKCEIVVTSPFAGQSAFLLRNALGTTFNVRTVYTRHILMGVLPTVISRNEPFALTLWAVDENNDLDLNTTTAVELSRALGGGNGDGGQLTHTNGNMLYKQDTYIHGSQTWRLQWSQACFQCTIMLGKATPIKMAVQTTATYLFVSVPSTALSPLTPFQVTVEARDENDNLDVTIGAALANGEKSNVGVSLWFSKNSDGTGSFDTWGGDGGVIQSTTEGVTLLMEDGIGGGKNGTLNVVATRVVDSAYIIARVQANGNTITSLNFRYAVPVSVQNPATALRVLTSLATVYAGDPFFVRVGVVDNSPVLTGATSFPGPFIARRAEGIVTLSTATSCPSSVVTSSGLMTSRLSGGETNFTVTLWGGSSCTLILSVSTAVSTRTVSLPLALNSVSPQQLRFRVGPQITAWVTNRTYLFDLTATDSAGRQALLARNDVALSVVGNVDCMKPYNSDVFTKNLVNGATTFTVYFNAAGTCPINLVSTGLDIVSKAPIVVQTPYMVKFAPNSTSAFGTVLYTGVEYSFVARIVDREGRVVMGDYGSLMTLGVNDPSVVVKNTNQSSPGKDAVGSILGDNVVHPIAGVFAFRAMFSKATNGKYVRLTVAGSNIEQGTLLGDQTDMFEVRTRATRVGFLTPLPRYYVTGRELPISIAALDNAPVPNIAYAPLLGHDANVEIRHFSLNNNGWLERLGQHKELNYYLLNGTSNITVRWVGPDGDYRMQLLSPVLSFPRFTYVQMQTIKGIKINPATVNWTSIRAEEEFTVEVWAVDADGNVVQGDYQSNVTSYFEAQKGMASFVRGTSAMVGGRMNITVLFNETTNNATIGFVLDDKLGNNFTVQGPWFPVDIKTPRTPSPDDNYVPPYLGLRVTAFGNNILTFNVPAFAKIMEREAGVLSGEVLVLYVCPPSSGAIVPADKTQCRDAQVTAGPTTLVTLAPSTTAPTVTPTPAATTTSIQRRLQQFALSGVAVEFQIRIDRNRVKIGETYIKLTANAVTALKTAILAAVADQTSPLAVELGVTGSMSIRDGSLPPPATTPPPTATPTPSLATLLPEGGGVLNGGARTHILRLLLAALSLMVTALVIVV
eukprot:PhM_4_TR5751/c0_g1_i1/m.35066